MAAKLIIVYWRDIPAQVMAKKGRESAKLMLSVRFQEAIDRAAMRAGKGGSEAYMSEWRREPQECSDDLQAEVDVVAERIENAWSDEDLAVITRNRGVAGEDG